jgi:hypothetical protein
MLDFSSDISEEEGEKLKSIHKNIFPNHQLFKKHFQYTV